MYGRKVDYLHLHAYRVQRDLVQKHGPTKPKNKRKTARIDKDIERFLNFDPNQEFLLLDDVIPYHAEDSKKTNQLKETTTRESVKLDDTFSGTFTRRQLSTSMMEMNIQRVSNILHSSQGLRLSSGQCHLDDNGMLWLPGSKLSNETTPNMTDALKRQQSFTEAAVANDVGDDDNVAMDDGMDDDDEVDAGAGFEMAMDEPSPAKQVTFAPQAVKNKPAPSPEQEDPWKLLDPDFVETKRPRPMRLGKTIVLPSCMKRLPSEQRKKKDPIPDYLNRPLLEPVETEPTSWTTGKRARETLPLRGLAYGNEFAYIAKEIAKRKARERKNANMEQYDVENEPLEFGGNFDDGDDDHDDGGFPAFGDDDGPIETNTGIHSVDDLYGNNEDGDHDAEGTLCSFKNARSSHF